jgi:hypothetical protein
MLLEHIYRARLVRRASRGTSGGDVDDLESSKVLVIGPPEVLRYQDFALSLAGLDDLVTFMPTVATLYAGCTDPVYVASGGALRKLTSVPVQHCRDSFGVVLEFNASAFRPAYSFNGTASASTSAVIKVVYSGDCRPSDSLVAAGRGCDLLVHEATFGDDMCGDAVTKRHCTTSEAAEVARRMRAKHTVLTHFSQRYPTAVQAQSQTHENQRLASEGSVLNNVHADATGMMERSIPIGLNRFAGEPFYSYAQQGAVSYSAAREAGIPHHPIATSAHPLPQYPFSVAFDLLKFAFPSQALALPAATDKIVTLIAALEEERERERKHITWRSP